MGTSRIGPTPLFERAGYLVGRTSGGSEGGGSWNRTLGSLGEDGGVTLGSECGIVGGPGDGEWGSLVERGESLGNCRVTGEIRSGGFRGGRRGTEGRAKGDTGDGGVGGCGW